MQIRNYIGDERRKPFRFALACHSDHLVRRVRFREHARDLVLVLDQGGIKVQLLFYKGAVYTRAQFFNLIQQHLVALETVTQVALPFEQVGSIVPRSLFKIDFPSGHSQMAVFIVGSHCLNTLLQ